MIQHFKTAMTSKYADFRTRSTRSEFWYFMLGYIILTLILFIPLTGMAFAATEAEQLSGDLGTIPLIFFGIWLILVLAMFIPSLAISVRRLHDIGRSGWWYLIAFIPLGSIVLLVMMCLESQPGANKWGPNPHELAAGGDVSDHLVKGELFT